MAVACVLVAYLIGVASHFYVTTQAQKFPLCFLRSPPRTRRVIRQSLSRVCSSATEFHYFQNSPKHEYRRPTAFTFGLTWRILGVFKVALSPYILNSGDLASKVAGAVEFTI